MRSINQVLVTAAPHDAVTSSALEIRCLMRTVAESEIFALHVHDALRGDVLSLEDHLGQLSRDDHQLTIVHLSMGNPRWLRHVLRLRGAIIVSYHNMTPDHFFRPWDPAMADLLKFGRATLGSLTGRTVLALANSRYSASELLREGYDNVKVGGLLFDIDTLSMLDPVPDVLEAGKGPPEPTILSVGQMYPHKRHDFVLAAFAHLLVEVPLARLVVVGPDRLTCYSERLKRYAQELGIDGRVDFAGEVSPEQLAAYFRRSDLLVSASEHEGFCVPLIEAMSMNLPVVARGFAAVPETVGDAGFVIDPEVSPRGMAAGLAGLVNDQVLCDDLRKRGARRARDFSMPLARERMLDLIKAVI